jgi:hypothetical protein
MRLGVFGVIFIAQMKNPGKDEKEFRVSSSLDNQIGPSARSTHHLSQSSPQAHWSVNNTLLLPMGKQMPKQVGE